MQSEAKFYGGSKEYSLGLASLIDDWDPRFVRFHVVEVTADVSITVKTSGIKSGTFFFFQSLGRSVGNIYFDNVPGAATVAPGTCFLIVFDGVSWRGRAVTIGTAGGIVRTQDRFYVVGGTGTGTSSVYLDFSTGLWVTGPTFGNAKVEAAGARLGGRAYFVGTDPIAAASNKNDELLLDAATVANRTDFPASVRRMSAALGEDASSVPAIFFYGGDDGSTAVASVFSYVFDAFATQVAMPIKRSRGIAVAVARQDRSERRVFILNGGDPSGQPVVGHLSRADFYWSGTTQPGASRRSVAGFARAGRAHQVGGYLDSPVTRYDLNEEYDPETNSWATRTALGASRYGGAGAVGIGRGFYAAGRDSADAASATASAYNGDVWAGLAAMPGARAEVRASGVAS